MIFGSLEQSLYPATKLYDEILKQGRYHDNSELLTHPTLKCSREKQKKKVVLLKQSSFLV